MAESRFSLADGTPVCQHAPFFITGSGRCGTTLLRRLILGRAKAVIPPENYTLGLSRHAMAMAAGNWDSFCRVVLHGVQTYVTNWPDFGIDEKRALSLLMNLPVDDRSIANFWHGFHALYAIGLGKPPETRWGDKTPANVDRVDDIAAIFPGAKFIFMVRDAFDTAYSFGSMHANREGNYTGGALRWAHANTKILSFAKTHRLESMIVRYEDLVASPDQVTQAVLGFLDLPRSDAGVPTDHEVRDMASQAHLRHVLDSVATDGIGKGRRALSDGIKEQIAMLTAPVQAMLGYEPTGSYPMPLLESPPSPYAEAL